MYSGGIILVLVAVIILLGKKDLSDSYKCIAVWLLFVALDFYHSLLNFFFFPAIPDLIVFPFAYAPLAYLYTRSLIERDYVFRLDVLIHFLPLLLFIMIPLFWPGEIRIDASVFWQLNEQTVLGLVNFCGFIILSVAYLLKVIRIIREHNRKIGDEFSFQSSRITLSWLKVTAGLMLLSFFLTAVFALVFSVLHINPVDPVAFFQVTMFAFSLIIAWFGIRQPLIFSKTLFPVTDGEKQRKYSRTGLHDEEEKRLAAALHHLMVNEKLYLNGNLMLRDVAEKLEIPSHYLSQVLSKQMNRNFFTYINEFRVEEAKKRIRDANSRNLTLLAIAYDSGFNSKSSFNTIFLKIEGLTPSAYRDRQ